MVGLLDLEYNIVRVKSYDGTRNIVEWFFAWNRIAVGNAIVRRGYFQSNTDAVIKRDLNTLSVNNRGLQTDTHLLNT